ncbi:MAG TPA: hypothetical protein P5060_02545 [Candidatus Absconditabacterales bacterium]|nr:hypothetical protein [Candidatus Absconditabacterales bacterium]
MNTFKKLFAGSAIFALLATLMPMYAFGASYSDELEGAYDYAYDNGITTMDSIDNADMYGSLTRIAMAKMMSNFAMDVLGSEPDTDMECTFPDVSETLDAQYDNGVTNACQLGLMGVGVDNFDPYGIVDRAQFGTVLSRALYGDMYNGADPYYADHLEALQDAGIMNNISNPMAPEVRGYVMLMMQRADEGEASNGCSAEELLACLTADDYEDCIAECADEEEEEVLPDSDGELTFDLNNKSPEAANIASNAQAVEFLTFDVEADGEDVFVSSITLERMGLGDRTDFDKVWLTHNDVIVSNDKSINSEDQVVLNVNMDIKDGNTETFTVVASMNGVSNKINSFAVIDVDHNGADVDGLPVEGEEMTTFNYTVAQLTFTAKGANTTIDVGAEDVILGEFKIQETTTATRDAELRSIRLKNTGTAKMTDLDNIDLYVDGSKVSEDVIVDGDYVTFVLEDDFIIEDGKSDNFIIKGDVLAGDNNATYIFNLKEKFDLYALEAGTSMGASILTPPVALSTYTVNAGKTTLSLDNDDNPASEEYVKETDDVLLMAVKVDTDQDINVDKIRVYIDAGSTDLSETNFESYFQNFALYRGNRLVDSTDDVVAVGDVNGGTAGLGDTVGAGGDDYLEFDIGGTLEDNDVLYVYVDIKSTAANNTALKLKMDNAGTAAGYSNTLRDVEYASNGDTVAQAKLSGTATSNTMTVVAASNGASVTRNDGYDANTTFLAGEQGAELMKFVVNAGNSSTLEIKRLNFDLDVTNSTYSDYTNVKVLIDGDQEGNTEDFSATTSPDGTVTVENINYEIAKNGQVQVTLVADISSSVTAEATTDIYVTLDDSDSLYYDRNGNDVSLSDATSAAFVVATTAKLTVAKDGDSPDAAIVIAGTDEVEVAKFKFTASDGDILVKDLYFENVDSAASDARVSSYELVVDGEVIDSRAPSSDTFHFNLGTNNGFTIPKDDNVVVTIRANLNNIVDAAQTNKGIKIELTDIKADTSATSTALTTVNTSVTIDDGSHYNTATASDLSDENIQGDAMMIRKTQPTLATVDLGTTKLLAGEQTIYKFTVTADSSEDVDVGMINFDSTLQSASGTVGSFKLFVNGVDKTSDGAFTSTDTFTFGTGKDVTVAAGTSKTFELKATIGGTLADNDYITTKLVEDSSTAAGNFAAAAGNFVWSDNAGSPHSRTTVDWFNGYKVNGLDTVATTLEK